MKSEKNWLNSGKVPLPMLLAVLLAALAGCTTVIPQQPESPSASYDGGVRNSGFICFTNLSLDNTKLTNDPHDLLVGIITTNALARYNSLIAIYGKRFNPPLNASEGTCDTCITNLILIQAQDLEHFARMNRWRLQEGK